MRGRGAEAERGQNPLRKKWVQHPICRVRFETARSKPSLSLRNGRSARVHSASAPRMCEPTRGSGAGMSKSARLRSATAPRMCERSFRPKWMLLLTKLFTTNITDNICTMMGQYAFSVLCN